MTDPLFTRPYDIAVARLHDAGGHLDALPIALQTLLVVEAAQLMIDSGGLAYFYEADFPNNPPYADFVAAYRRIGAESAADCIERTAAMFPFGDPELFEPLRLLWLEKLGQDPQGEFRRLSDRISGDGSVWTLLDAYVQAHRHAFADA
jgi:hypothetical protein